MTHCIKPSARHEPSSGETEKITSTPLKEYRRWFEFVHGPPAQTFLKREVGVQSMACDTRGRERILRGLRAILRQSASS